MGNQQEPSSKGWIMIITSIIGVIGTITVAYFAFRGAIFPAQLDLQRGHTWRSVTFPAQCPGRSALCSWDHNEIKNAKNGHFQRDRF